MFSILHHLTPSAQARSKQVSLLVWMVGGLVLVCLILVLVHSSLFCGVPAEPNESFKDSQNNQSEQKSTPPTVTADDVLALQSMVNKVDKWNRLRTLACTGKDAADLPSVTPETIKANKMCRKVNVLDKQGMAIMDECINNSLPLAVAMQCSMAAVKANRDNKAADGGDS